MSRIVIVILMFYRRKPIDLRFVVSTNLPSEIHSYMFMIFRSKYIHELFWTELRCQVFETEGNIIVS
jgi:hypothetical protein